MGGSSTRQAPPQTATQVTQLPAFVQPTAQRYLNRAEALSQAPFQSYQGTRISPLNSVHNFALDQARQQFMPQMTGAATQMGNFMGGAFNEPAYIHPYLGPMLPMQSYQGISRPYPVGPGGSPGGGGKGGQQPSPQYPVQPGFPSGPPDPITGTPIDPTQPTFPEIPAPTTPGPTAPVTGDGSVGLPSFVEDSGGSADENFDGSSPIGTSYDMSNFPDENTGSFAQYAPTLGRIGGALAPIPGGYFLGGMIGDSIADAYSDETLADVYDPGYNYGDQALGYGQTPVADYSYDTGQNAPYSVFTGGTQEDQSLYTPAFPDNVPVAASYDQLEAQTMPAPEMAPTMPAPEALAPPMSGPVDSQTNPEFTDFSAQYLRSTQEDDPFVGMSTMPGPPMGKALATDITAPTQPVATPIVSNLDPISRMDFAMALAGLAPGTNVSLYSGGQQVAPGTVAAPAGVNIVSQPPPGYDPTADEFGFTGYDDSDISFADIGDFGFDSDIGLGF